MILGFLLISVSYILGRSPLLMYMSRLADELDEGTRDAFYASGDLSYIGLDNNLGFLLMLLTFVIIFLAFWAFMRTLYGLSLKEIITPFERIRWGRVFWGFGLIFLMSAISEGLSYLLSPESYSLTFDLQSFLPLLVICFLILPIQTSIEELFIRGYLMPHLSHIANKAIVGLLVTSLLFAIMHMDNPEVREHGMLLTFPYYFISAVFLGLMTILDDGLEMALGVHFGVNLFGASIVSYEAAVIPTRTIWESTETNPAMVLVVGTVISAVFLWLSAKKYDWPSLKVLLDDIITEKDKNEYEDYA